MLEIFSSGFLSVELLMNFFFISYTFSRTKSQTFTDYKNIFWNKKNRRNNIQNKLFLNLEAIRLGQTSSGSIIISIESLRKYVSFFVICLISPKFSLSKTSAVWNILSTSDTSKHVKTDEPHIDKKLHIFCNPHPMNFLIKCTST